MSLMGLFHEVRREPRTQQAAMTVATLAIGMDSGLLVIDLMN
jgi:hypothetical protein